MTQQNNIVHLNQFKQRKKEEELLSRGRKPLYVSHARGKVAGAQEGQLSDFGDRIAEIRSSLEKINHLMADLEKLPSEKVAR